MKTERIVIVGYKPFPGKEAELKKLVAGHFPRLSKEGLVSDRQPIVMQAQDGTFVEVFGWASKEAIEKAHHNPEVQKIWTEFGEVCEFVPVGEIPGLGNLFSEFEPIE